jgi:hypothetical protein
MIRQIMTPYCGIDYRVPRFLGYCNQDYSFAGGIMRLFCGIIS